MSVLKAKLMKTKAINLDQRNCLKSFKLILKKVLDYFIKSTVMLGTKFFENHQCWIFKTYVNQLAEIKSDAQPIVENSVQNFSLVPVIM